MLFLNIKKGRNVSVHPKTPAKYKQFLLTWSVIYPLITTIFEVFGNWLVLLPIALRTLLVSGLSVFLMTYLLMPFLTAKLGGWLRSQLFYREK